MRGDLADAAFFDKVDDEAKQMARELREACLALPDPEPLSMFDHVYADRHPLMTEEQERFAAYLASFEEEAK